jgi:hypothetical protein
MQLFHHQETKTRRRPDSHFRHKFNFLYTPKERLFDVMTKPSKSTRLVKNITNMGILEPCLLTPFGFLLTERTKDGGIKMKVRREENEKQFADKVKKKGSKCASNCLNISSLCVILLFLFVFLVFCCWYDCRLEKLLSKWEQNYQNFRSECKVNPCRSREPDIFFLFEFYQSHTREQNSNLFICTALFRDTKNSLGKCSLLLASVGNKWEEPTRDEKWRRRIRIKRIYRKKIREIEWIFIGGRRNQ